jgi:hypothetical protein
MHRLFTVKFWTALLLCILGLSAAQAQTCGLDIHIANDNSGSVDAVENRQSRAFVSQLGLAFDPLGTANNQARVSISTWDWQNRFIQYSFPQAGPNYTTSLADVLSYANSARTLGGGTDVNMALTRAAQIIDQNPIPGRNANKVIVLMTDASCFQIAPSIRTLATQLKSRGIYIVVMAIDAATTCPVLQGTNVASPGGYFAADEYAKLFTQAISYINSIRGATCTAPPAPYDLQVSLSNFQVTNCTPGPAAPTVNYSVNNISAGQAFTGNLRVSFYSGDPTLPTSRYLFTENAGPQTISPGGAFAGTSTNALLANASTLYAVANFDGSATGNGVPLSYATLASQLAVAGETNASNNISPALSRVNGVGCVPAPILNTQVVSSGLGCGDRVLYTVRVCNNGTGTATGLKNNITQYPPAGFTLVSGQLVGQDPFVGNDLPAGSCAIYEYVYNVAGLPAGTVDYSVGVAVADPSTNGTGIVSTYGGAGCTGPGSISGTMTQGVAVSGVTMTLYANVTKTGTWSLSAVSNGVTFSGSGTFTTLGCQPITLTATGIPTATGPFTWCTNSTPQGCASATVANPVPSNPLGSGSLSGRTCFDIAETNNNINGCAPLTARIPLRADFNQTATNTQTYTFTPSGTVSNVRFVYINTTQNVILSLTGGNAGNNISTAVTATAVYNQDLSSDNPSAPSNALALGLTNSNPLTADIYVIYNDGATNNGTDRQLRLTAQVKDCACCGAYVAPGVWKNFLCHNLGAYTDIDPHDMTQADAWKLNGAYIQWGKRGPNITGDSRVDWITALNNGALGFVAAPTGPAAGQANANGVSNWSTDIGIQYEWRTASGAKGVNDPCPTGWRIPTLAEFSGIRNNNTRFFSGPFVEGITQYNSADHYGPNSSTKLLTFPAAGLCGPDLEQRGEFVNLWAANPLSGLNGNRYFSGIGFTANVIGKSWALPIRCIEE